MKKLRVHLTHVGNTSNKGVQALLKSDLLIIREVAEAGVSFSVSTTDVDGVRRQNPQLEAILPHMVDIPYERTDSHAKRRGYKRERIKYKAIMVAYTLQMPLQIFLSVASTILTKLGVKRFYRSEVLKEIKSCDVVVSYSDESFKDGLFLLPSNVYWKMVWWSMLLSRTWEILVAKFYRKPVIVFPNSIGPFRTRIGYLLSKLALGLCDCILVRDSISYEILKSMQISTPKALVSDTTLLLEPSENKTRKPSLDPVVGVSPGFYANSLTKKEQTFYIASHAKALDNAIDQYGFTVVFLPHYVSGFSLDDLEISRLIYDQMRNKDKAQILNVETVEELKSLLGKMDLVISSRMHPTVMAASASVPVVCIAYDQKQVGLLEQLGIPEYLVYIGSLTSDTLLEKIKGAWTQREEIKGILKTRIPVLQRQLRDNIRKAMTAIIKTN